MLQSPANPEGDIASAEDISGYRDGKEIWIRKSDAINLLDNYFHEVGHVLGDIMSFRNGDVLTPDEVKLNIPEFPREKLIRLHQLLFAKSPFLRNPKDIQEIIQYSNRIMMVFTKGKFKPGSRFKPRMIRLHTDISQNDLLRTIRQHGGANTIHFTSDDTIEYVDGRNGRNSEISSHVTEIACLRLHENAIRVYDSTYAVINSPPQSPAHRRAFLIVQRAYVGNGWTVPSRADLRQDLGKNIQS